MKFACIDRPCHAHLSLGARRGARRSGDPTERPKPSPPPPPRSTRRVSWRTLVVEVVGAD
jgi:hypothetical protein